MFNVSSGSGKWTIYGNKTPIALIAGHSHTFALLMAIRKNENLSKVFGVVAEAKDKQLGKGITRDNEYWKYVAKLSPAQSTFISWNGNQHNIHFLLDELKPFQIFDIYREHISAPAVPKAQLRELFAPTFSELRATLNLFSRFENVTLLGTPAPKPKKFIDKVLMNDEYFSTKANSIGIPSSKILATSDALRLAMWHLTQVMTKEVADEFGIKFMPTPNFSLDSNGLLSEEFWADDITHTNQHFGEFFLDELCRELAI